MKSVLLTVTTMKRDPLWRPGILDSCLCLNAHWRQFCLLLLHCYCHFPDLSLDQSKQAVLRESICLFSSYKCVKHLQLRMTHQKGCLLIVFLLQKEKGKLSEEVSSEREGTWLVILCGLVLQELPTAFDWFLWKALGTILSLLAIQDSILHPPPQRLY